MAPRPRPAGCRVRIHFRAGQGRSKNALRVKLLLNSSSTSTRRSDKIFRNKSCVFIKNTLYLRQLNHPKSVLAGLQFGGTIFRVVFFCICFNMLTLSDMLCIWHSPSGCSLTTIHDFSVFISISKNVLLRPEYVYNVLLENVRPANVFASCFISFRRRRSRTKSTPVSVSCSGAVSCNAPSRPF